MLFQASRLDGRSFRDVAVDAMKGAEPETIISYEALGKALGLSPKNDLHKIQAAARAANIILLKYHSRGIKNVSNVGYRMIPARENMIVAGNHQTRADRAHGRAVAFFDGANLEQMTATERKTHEGLSIIAHQLAAGHAYIKGRFDRLEALFKGPVIDQK